MRFPSIGGLALLGALLASAGPGRAEAPGPPYTEVTIAPSKTSIYIGSVTLTLSPLVRENGGFAATYTAKVWPFFFAGERGTISIDFSDEDLRRLMAREPVDFTGDAETDDGEPRRITGRAEPADDISGDIKVRVHVSKNIELVFDTTYRFTGKAMEGPKG